MCRYTTYLSTIALLLTLLSKTYTQSTSVSSPTDRTEDVKAMIDRLFEALKQSDTGSLASLFRPAAQLNTVLPTGEIRSETIAAWLKSTASIAPGRMEEKLLSVDVQVDANLAVAWTPYIFYVDSQQTHCGVNVIQAVQREMGWQIMSITDTRHQDCQRADEAQIGQLIDDWHLAAATADYDSYFGFFSPDGIFLGTDATEKWTRDQFADFALPYFQQGKAWSFTAVDRAIYQPSAAMAWFDEILDTWMGPCRGSGVLVKPVGGRWQLKHYNLAILVPNELVKDYLDLRNKNR